jgi:uncharacterized cupredoxin-like copper-binding protein
VLLAGCTSSGGPGGGMMGGPAGTTGSPGWMGPGWMGMGSMMSTRLTCAAPTSLPGTRVTVALGDMGMFGGSIAPRGMRMMLQSDVPSVPAGQVTFVAENYGRRTHELVVLPLAGDQPPGTRTPGADGQVDEADSLGEAAAPCAEGSGGGLTSGTVGWLTVTLPPGRYELLCNLPNHYANAMWQEFDVV